MALLHKFSIGTVHKHVVKVSDPSGGLRIRLGSIAIAIGVPILLCLDSLGHLLAITGVGLIKRLEVGGNREGTVDLGVL